MVYRYHQGKVALNGPFGTNNFHEKWTTRSSSQDAFGLSIRREFPKDQLQERAKPEQMHHKGYWEGGSSNPPFKTASNLRFYPKREYIVRNQDFSPRELQTALPPISTTQVGNDSNKLRDSLGKDLFHLPSCRFKKVQQAFEENDKQNTGFIPLSYAQEVLHAHGCPGDEQLQVLLLQRYSAGDSEWITYEPMLNFMRNTRELYAVKYGTQYGLAEAKPRALPGVLRRHSGPARRDDVTPKPNEVVPQGVDYLSMSHDRVHGVLMRAAFADRRDATLIVEMESQFRKAGPRVEQLVEQLRDAVGKIADEDQTIPGYKIKELMQKLKFPFNLALMDKLIDRMSPNISGSIRWVEFVNFVERATLEIRQSARKGQPETTVPSLKAKAPLAPLTSPANGF